MGDKELWDGLREGSRLHLKQIYTQHVDALLQYGCRFARDHALVEDCIHDMFVDLWKKHDGLGPTDSVIRYLLVTLRRRIFKALKLQQRRDRIESNTSFEIEPDRESYIVATEAQQEIKVKMKAAMDELSERQREAVYLKYYEQLSYEEICTVMDISYQSARNLVAKTIKKLRKHMTLLLAILFFVGY